MPRDVFRTRRPFEMTFCGPQSCHYTADSQRNLKDNILNSLIFTMPADGKAALVVGTSPDTIPTDIGRNNNVIITSKRRRFHVMLMLLLRHVSAGRKTTFWVIVLIAKPMENHIKTYRQGWFCEGPSQLSVDLSVIHIAILRVITGTCSEVWHYSISNCCVRCHFIAEGVYSFVSRLNTYFHSGKVSRTHSTVYRVFAAQNDLKVFNKNLLGLRILLVDFSDRFVMQYLGLQSVPNKANHDWRNMINALLLVSKAIQCVLNFHHNRQKSNIDLMVNTFAELPNRNGVLYDGLLAPEKNKIYTISPQRMYKKHSSRANLPHA